MSRVFLITVILLVMTNVSAYSQIGVTSYSFRSFGLSTGKEKKIGAELKAFFEHRYEYVDYDEQIFEFAGFYNFKSREYHRFSVGLGVTFVPEWNDMINSFSFPVQLEIFPLKNQKFDRLSLIVELSPEKVIDAGEGFPTFRYLLGIRYNFKKLKIEN